MKQFLLLTFGLYLGALASGQVKIDPLRNVEERILGGQPTKEGEFPYIVSITVNGDHICGGFIFNQRFIVTAASCIADRVPSTADVAVVVGQHSLITTDPYERRYQVVSILVHETYNADMKLDNIALIEVSQSIAFTPGHVEVGFYNEADIDKPEATVAGWGATTLEGLPTVDLLKATVDIAQDCKSYGSEVYQPNYMICAGSLEASPCQYDEGSPLVQGDNIIGIGSNNAGCAEPVSLPSLYIRLTSYYAWLLRNAGQQPPRPTTTPAPAPAGNKIQEY